MTAAEQLAAALTRIIEEARLTAPTAEKRFCSAKAASAAYPVSKGFLYERGEALGFVHRPLPGGKVVVDLDALERWLGGGTSRFPQGDGQRRRF